VKTKLKDTNGFVLSAFEMPPWVFLYHMA